MRLLLAIEFLPLRSSSLHNTRVALSHIASRRNRILSRGLETSLLTLTLMPLVLFEYQIMVETKD